MKTIDNLAEKYSHSPNIRALVQLVPFGVGSAIDVLLTENVIKMRYERFELLIDNLVNSEAVLTEELISKEDFLHNYFLTVKAVLSTKRREKINYISNLFIGYLNGNMDNNNDEYEELLLILDELTFREMEILILLKRYETINPLRENENELQRAIRFWEAFSNELITELNISSPIIKSSVIRLTRTGLCELFLGYWDEAGDKVRTTPLFDLLLTKLNES